MQNGYLGMHNNSQQTADDDDDARKADTGLRIRGQTQY